MGPASELKWRAPARLLVAVCVSVALPPSTLAQGTAMVMSRDEQAANLLRRYRDDYEKNRKIVEECERRNGTNCEEAGCWTDVAFGENGTGGPSFCAPPNDVHHAWQQENFRRQCEQTSGRWWPSLQGNQLYGECSCPSSGLDEFLRDGHIDFLPFQGGCISDRKLCIYRGGTFFPARKVAAVSKTMLTALAGPRPGNIHDCEYQTARSEDFKRGQFIYSHWSGSGNRARCELTVLQGFPTVTKPRSSEEKGFKVVEKSLCKMPQPASDGRAPN